MSSANILSRWPLNLQLCKAFGIAKLIYSTLLLDGCTWIFRCGSYRTIGWMNAVHFLPSDYREFEWLFFLLLCSSFTIFQSLFLALVSFRQKNILFDFQGCDMVDLSLKEEEETSIAQTDTRHIQFRCIGWLHNLITFNYPGKAT